MYLLVYYIDSKWLALAVDVLIVGILFQTTYIVSSGSRQRTSSGLEKLPFYNHTECECQDHMEETMPRDAQGTEARAERMSEQGYDPRP